MSKHERKVEVVSRSAKQAHILIVDDEEDIAVILRKSLGRKGYKVSDYYDPRKALSEFRRGMFDLAFLDIRMPGMNGFELAKRIKKIDMGLKICFLTAFDLEKEDFTDNGFPQDSIDCFIRKPVHIAEFIKKVSALLDAR